MTRQTRMLSRAGQRQGLAALLAASTILAGPGAAFAAGNISNSAVATGTYDDGSTQTPVASTPSVQNVPLADPTIDLVVTKTGVINGTGDAIDYTITLTNNSDVELTNVAIDSDTLTFDGTASSAAVSGFSPAGPFTLGAAGSGTETQTITVTYAMAAQDIYRAAGVTDGVQNVVTITGEQPGPGGTTTPITPVSDTALNTITADPQLTIVKVAQLQDLNGNSLADTGEHILYTYTVTNTGNVALQNVSIQDTHEGAVLATNLFVEDESTLVDGVLANSTDTSVGGGSPTDGVWDTLGQGAVVEFTYDHTVTPTEFANQ